MKRAIPIGAFALLFAGAAGASAQDASPQIRGQVPVGYRVLSTATGSFGDLKRRFYIVAIGTRPVDIGPVDYKDARPRPLLIFGQRPDGRLVLIARNNHVVLRADQGGQCDPFGDGNIAVKGRYFTVENSVACGNHWTDFITFRFDPRLNNFVFDNERYQSWRFNPSPRDDVEALLPDPQHVERPAKGTTILFSEWRSR